ncbi:hypothetical protein [Tenacibaculum haliotis]|uniref:hypothetical protein n=1 Tax=Tenacibaculum haliotis TaxID=1888914 RepID=UPI0021AFEFBF|nr:hypothetical protein [Tenacibaculum haliotis]MCT4699431.1 hypothetical protein [Tenacibaculum haliotis]
MKKSILKTVLPTILLIIAIAIIGSGCGDGLSPSIDPSNECSDAETTIETALSALPTNSMDLQIHEYTFETSVTGSICEIGYQSLQQTTPFAINNTSINYTIEIVGGPSITNTFSSSMIEYKTIGGSFEILPGVTYTLRRTGGDGLNSSTGHTSTATFPYTSGYITFLSSNFVDSSSTGGGPVTNNGIPKIYFKFKAN